MNQIQKTLLRDADGNEYYFDAVFTVSHNLSVQVTEHPVQSGASIADHAFVDPDEVSMDVGFSDVHSSRYYFESGTPYSDAALGNSDGRSITAYDLLRQIAQAREPVTLVTKLHTYPSMLITSVSVSDDAKTMFGLRASVTLRAIQRVTVATMTIQQTCSSSKITYANAESDSGQVSQDALLSWIYSQENTSGTANTTVVSPGKGSGGKGSKTNSSILNDLVNSKPGQTAKNGISSAWNWIKSNVFKKK